MELYENIFSRKVQVIKSIEGDILFNYKHLMTIFNKITKVYLKVNYKHKGGDIVCENDTIQLKKSDKFLDLKGVRTLISKSKEENAEQLEDFFTEEMYRIKFLSQNNESQKLLDLMNIQLHDFPDAVHSYKKQKNTKSQKNSNSNSKSKSQQKSKSKTKSVKKVKSKEIVEDREDDDEQDHLPLEGDVPVSSPSSSKSPKKSKPQAKVKSVKKIKSKEIIEDSDDDDDEQQNHLPISNDDDVQEASTSSSKNDVSKDKFLIISKQENKYKIIKNDYTIEEITDKGYKIVYKSSKDIFEHIDSIVEKLNVSDNREICIRDNNNIIIRKPLTEEVFINTLHEILN